MKTSTKFLASTALAVALALGLTACSGDDTLAPIETSPVATASAEPTETALPVEPAASPVVGDTVTDIAAAQLAGAHVFVAPGASTGVVIDPTQPLPAQVVQAVQDAVPATLNNKDEFDAMVTSSGDMIEALRAAGVGVGIVVPAPSLTGSSVTEVRYTLRTSGNLPGAKEFGSAHPFKDGSTAAEVLAHFQPYFDSTPGVFLIDGTK